MAPRLRVIVADDHPIVLSGLEALLSRAELEIVAIALNGADTLARIRELRPDIALLDINMPVLTGLDVLDALEGEGIQTRVLLLTSYATQAQLTKAVRCGAWGIVFKDTAGDTLLDAIRQVSVGQQWFDSDQVSAARTGGRDDCAVPASWMRTLTAREQELAGLVALGLTNKDIAHRLRIAEGTVKVHLHKIFEKTGVSNRTGLAASAHGHSSPTTSSDVSDQDRWLSSKH
jgi:two-component system, NarL family, nitrate/nitrite response regulator NarL